jgi:hypothetical protein
MKQRGRGVTMKRLIWLVPLALAGCGKKAEVEVKNASVAEVAAKMKEAGVDKTTLHPGLWAVTVKVDNISAPGVPPEMEQQMRKGIGQTRTMTECMTQEQAKKPFENFAKGQDDCRYDHFTMGDGKVDSKLICTKDGLSRSMLLQGTYSPEQYNMQMQSEALGQGRIKRINMSMTLNAKRAGECPA